MLWDHLCPTCKGSGKADDGFTGPIICPTCGGSRLRPAEKYDRPLTPTEQKATYMALRRSVRKVK